MFRTFKYKIHLAFLLWISASCLIINLKAQNLFIENGGRFPGFVKYSFQFDNGMTYYTNYGYTILLRDPEALDSMWHHYHTYKTLKHDFIVPQHRLDVRLPKMNLSDILPEYASITRFNFYKENGLRATNLRAYRGITYRNCFSKIDWQIRAGNGSVKQNYIVHPGANVRDIYFEYLHHSGIEIRNEKLVIKTSVGQLIEEKPIAFQVQGLDTIWVDCKFRLSDERHTTVRFELGAYNPTLDLIIDPILVFSTYSGSEGDNFGFTATYDSKSHLYAGGIVDGGSGTNGGPFPVTPGAYQTVYSGGQGLSPANLPCDIGINKYDSAGTTLLYSTYLGGSRDEYPHSLVVDNSDNLLVMGTCYSPDFPMDTTGFDLTFNGQTDIFIVKLSEDGSSMLGSTFIGGSDIDGLNTRSLRYNYADDFRGDIVVDSSDNVYVASTTYSTDFPLKNALQNSRASIQDGCVFSLTSSLDSLRFSTYIGGNRDDAMYSIRIYNDTFICVGGGTASNAMAFSVNGHTNAYIGGRADGFIVKLDIFGTLVNSSYFGTTAYDQIYFLDLDASGQIYASGQTEGNINRTAGTYGKDNTGQFIIRYTPNLSALNMATTFGNRTNNPELSPSAFLVDKCDNIYFSGWGSPITDGTLHSLTTKDLVISNDAIQKTTDNSDFYLIILGKNARKLMYATYYGGNLTEDHVDGGTSRFDKKGVVYQSVCASCPEPGNHYDDFPISAGAPFKTNLSPRCSNASFKIDFQINFEVDAKFTANPKIGCQPLEVTFTNQSKNATQYFWDFGDGSPIDTSKNPKHTFLQPGKYKVRLTTIDSFSCNLSSFDSTEIEVIETPVADFEYTTKECSREFEFKNKSQNYTDPIWDFGDSTNTSGDDNPKHTFTKNGDFTTLLTVKHPISGCTDTQTVVIKLYDDPSKTIKIPNVITPNGDGKNECFTIEGITPGCDEIEVWIYNRWGVLLFHGNLPSECWNGKVNNTGNEAPTGMYFYILEVKSKNPNLPSQLRYEGVVHIIR
ncbi:MAG: gliding motility-associated C-terminal domain-containing protein [Bacteroidetes bacterium]|nr:gliding motility-associated C-terminal domain-containing protein [Bacteroidota bacterium]